ncbi:MAG: site-specific DNA-methyltransferase, partial [Candidatus Pacearchaeota archaeon]
KYKEKIQTIYIDPPFNKEQDADYLYNVKYKDSTWASMLENRLRLARDFLSEKGSIFVRCDYNGNWIVRPIMYEIFGVENFRNEITIRRTEGKSRIEGLSFSIGTESLIFFANSDEQIFSIPFVKTELFENIEILKEKIKKYSEDIRKKLNLILDEIFWLELDHRPGERTTSSTIEVYGKLFKAPNGRHWILNQKRINEAISKEKVRLICVSCKTIFKEEILKCRNCNGNEFKIQIYYDEESLTTNWTRIQSYAQTNFNGIKFPTENSEILLKYILLSTSLKGDFILDFFLGSGTTISTAQKLGRRWIGIEMGEHFWTVVLPRMKKVVAYDKTGISKEKDVQEIYNEKTAGGFFKYQILEQYEDTLDNLELEENKELSELFKDEFLIKYFLDFETRNSPYFLNIKQLSNPFNYKLKVNLTEVGEPQEKIIDIPETFNYLLGINVKKIKFRLNGRKYQFILGDKEGQNVVIVWRDYSDDWNEKDYLQDKDFIMKEIEEWQPTIIYVNGQSTLTDKNGMYEIRYIEPEFKRLMEG